MPDRRLNLGIGFDPSDVAAANSVIDNLNNKGNASATAMHTGYLAVSQAIRDVIQYGGQLVRWQTENIRLAQEDQRAITGRNAALQATGQFSRELASALDNQASQLQRNLGISDSYTVELQRQLAAQKNTGESIDELTEASIGLSRVMGGDLSDNTVKISKFIQSHATSLKGTSIEVDKNASAQQRLDAVIQASLPGWAILNAEAEDTAGKAHTAAEALGEIRETIGGQIGNSPDMASAFDAIGKSLFTLNDGLRETGGLGGSAAEAMLTVASAAFKAAAGAEAFVKFLTVANQIGQGDFSGVQQGFVGDAYRDSIFYSASQDIDKALNAQRDKNQRYQNLPPDRMKLYDFLEDVKSEAPGLQIPQTTTPFIDSLDLPKRKREEQSAMSMYGYPEGFRPQNSELSAAAGMTVGGQRQFAGMGAFIGGNVIPFDRPFRVPNLSGGVTVGRDPRQNAIFDHRYDGFEEDQIITRRMMLNKSFGGEGLASIAGGLLDGGGRGGFGAALGLAGSAFGPWGAVGGSLLGKLFGGGGKSKIQRGDSESFPVFTRDVQTRNALLDLAQAFYAQTAAIGGRGLDSSTAAIQRQLQRVA